MTERTELAADDLDNILQLDIFKNCTVAIIRLLHYYATVYSVYMLFISL